MNSHLASVIDLLLRVTVRTPLVRTPLARVLKGPRFLNMMMTFVLHPLSHYNSITEPRARFLLSLLEDLSIDFPSHFILSLIDIYRDTITHDKLIFPSAIMRILRHFSVSYLEFPHFSMMGTINTATVRWSIAQLRPRQPHIEMIALPASTASSTSAPSSLVGGVTLKAIMTQLLAWMLTLTLSVMSCVR